MDVNAIIKRALGNMAYQYVKSTPSAFAGGTTNARGDDGGTSDPKTIFTVTGDVMMAVFGVCTIDLVSAGGGTLSVGPSGNGALMMPVTTATDIDAGELWMDATPAIGKAVDSLSYYFIGNGTDIVETVGTADITAGQIYYIAFWIPLSEDGNVQAVTS